MPEAISDEGLTPPLILICCSPSTEVGVISHLIYSVRKENHEPEKHSKRHTGKTF